jgi:pimeloyl-ACP methyl ester carboxylesterase
MKKLVGIGRIMKSVIIAVLLVMLLNACSPEVKIVPLGERKFGKQEAQVEEIHFRSGKFNLVGDLRLPEGDGPHPAIIMVHGSGNATRDGAVPFSAMIEIFLRNGYAVFSWDKPGSGGSTGHLEHELTQRAAILTDGIEVLVEHPSIDPARIGLWGISQAGWVMPLALEQTNEVAFMIVVSGGAEDSIEQMAYQLGQRILSFGGSEEDAALFEKYRAQAVKATTYADYREAMNILNTIPNVEQIVGFSLEIAEEADWKPRPRDSDAFIDPSEIINHITIPVLAFYGDIDKNIDPVQGAEAYQIALETAGNQDYQIEVIHGAAHVFVSDLRYVETLESWLQHLSD